MEYFEQRFYEYQTIARGLLEPASLVAAFERTAPYYDCLLQHIPADRDALILDVACGFGNFSYFLRLNGYRNVRGIDFDPNQVALAKSIGLHAECGDAFAALDATKPDAIAAIDFLEHLDKNAAIQFLEKCWGALPQSGILILRLPCCDFMAGDRYDDITHRWGVTSNAIRGLLRMAGFADVHIVDPMPPGRGVVGKFRLYVCKALRSVAGFVFKLMYVGAPGAWSRSLFVVAVK
jgi:SAM-dependent methyltransferase